MISFSFLHISERKRYLPLLFDILFENMSRIVPSDLNYDEQREEWLAAVSPALEKLPRRLMICFYDGVPVGYIQYYTSGHLIMVEEVQLKRRYQGTLLFNRLCRQVCSQLSPDITIIEAYCERRNIYSKKLMKKLGFQVIPDTECIDFIHLRGSVQRVRDKLKI